jgi:N-acetyl-alpha-D-muramate 1-phosphate uridylyltransferase
MKAMILAAGRGERMRPLTDNVPKPLLVAGGRPLIVHLIDALAAAGYRELVINHSYLGATLEQALGDGSRYGVRIDYSSESDGALETGGGIYRALPLLGERFIAVNGDIATDFPFARLAQTKLDLAHLVLIDNPVHHPKGDFVLRDDGRVSDQADVPRVTFAGIGVYRAELFAGCAPGKFQLAPLLRGAMGLGRVTGERYTGRWMDVGTPERLAELDRALSARK